MSLRPEASLLTIAAALALVTASGCDCAGPPAASCTTASDCQAGQQCVDMRCVAQGDGGSSDGATTYSDAYVPPRPDGGPGPRCGDGVLRAGEQCDDGNTMPGDGCDATCAIEPNYVCPTPGSPCTSTSSAATE